MFPIRIKNLFCILMLLPATLHTYAQTFVDNTPSGFKTLNFVGGHAAWADYDNDGDLDVCMAGLKYGSGPITATAYIYRNDGNGSFSDPGISFTGGTTDNKVTVIWLDYDNDGQPDLLLLFGGAVQLYQNKAGVFTLVANTGLPPLLSVSGGAAGDYNNDGYPDLAISGFRNVNRITRIYRNNRQGGFEETAIPLHQVSSGDIAWADYDNDGLLDLMTNGSDGNSTNRLYRNLGNGNFSAGTMVGTFGMHNSSIAWGDYDNDGYPDLLLTGYSDQLRPQPYSTTIYHNDAGAGFTKLNVSLQSISGTAVWGDCNNDGLLDIVLTGQTAAYPTETSATQLYLNGGGNTFTLAPATFAARTYSTVSLADFNKDGRLDILWFGSELSNSFDCVLYRNTISSANSSPSPPVGRTYAISADEKSVTFTWPRGLDVHTPANGLYYNIYLYEVPATGVKINAHATNTGYRKLVSIGNATQHTSYTFHGLEYDKTYRWSVQSIDASWAGSSFAPEQTFSTRKTQTIQLNDLIHQYGDPDFIPATVNSGLPLTIELGNPRAAALLPDGKIRIKAADTCTLVVYHHGNSEWLPTVVTIATLEFKPGMLTVAADNKKITYGDAIPALTYRISGFAGSETESVLTQPVQITTTANSSSGAGTYPVTAGGAAAANYSITYQPGTLTIDPKKLEIVLTPVADKTYGSADFPLGIQSDAALPVVYSSSQPGVATIDAAGTIHITGTGTTNIIASQQTAGNYLGDTALLTLRVVPASQTITIPAIAIKTFGDADFDPQAQSSAGLPLQLTSSDANVATITGDGKIHITGAGTATITAMQSGNANYSSASGTAALTVAKAAQTITFQPLPVKTFGDADFAPAVQSSAGLPVQLASSDVNVATITGDGKIHITGAGTATITATQNGNANYGSASATAALTVEKTAQTITFQPLPVKTFGDADFTPQAQSSTGLPLTFSSSDANVAIVTSDGKIHITGAGTATITATQSGNANYNSANATATLTVNKTTQTISFQPLPVKTFGDADFAPQAQSSTGLPLTFSSSDANVAIVTSDGKIHITGAGTATITATQSGNANYNSANTTAILTVGKAAQTITFPPLPVKAFGDPDFTPAAQSSAGLPVTFTSANAAVAVITTGGNIQITGTGTTTITATQPGNANYNSASATAVFTVNKAVQTITFDPLPVKTFGDADFTVSATASGGLPVSLTSSDAAVATVDAAGLVHITGAGTATITAAQPGNGTYTAATAARQLTVKKATQTITFGPMAARDVNDPPFDPGATASSGLPVTYESENTNVAAVANGMVTPVRAGSTRITARQAGNSNFEAATAVTQALDITSSGKEIKVGDAVTPNGDGINDYLPIEGLRNFPDNEIHIANAAGRILFEAKPYRNDFRGYASHSSQLLPKGVYYYVFFYTSGSTRKKVTGFFVLEY